MITIFSIAYNEIIMLSKFVEHYRRNFPYCRIVIYSNESDDGTDELAISLGCEVIVYKTGGKLSDKTYLEIKNTCWRNAKTDWVLISDIDEFCDLDTDDIVIEEALGTTLLRFEGYNMIGMDGTLNIDKIDHGVRAPSYDKTYCFRRSKIESINYGPGAHSASPVGEIKYSDEVYRTLHYKYIEVEYMIKRHKHFASRLSDDNKKHNYGGHYLFPEKRIRKEFEEARKQAIKIL